jgi:hypothetical protein
LEVLAILVSLFSKQLFSRSPLLQKALEMTPFVSPELDIPVAHTSIASASKQAEVIEVCS